MSLSSAMKRFLRQAQQASIFKALTELVEVRLTEHKVLNDIES